MYLVYGIFLSAGKGKTNDQSRIAARVESHGESDPISIGPNEVVSLDNYWSVMIYHDKPLAFLHNDISFQHPYLPTPFDGIDKIEVVDPMKMIEVEKISLEHPFHWTVIYENDTHVAQCSPKWMTMPVP